MITRLTRNHQTELDILLQLSRDKAKERDDPLAVADLDRYGSWLVQIQRTAATRIKKGEKIYAADHLPTFRKQVYEESLPEVGAVAAAWGDELERQHRAKRAALLDCLPTLDPAMAREIRDELRKAGDDLEIAARFAGRPDPQLLAAIVTAPTAFPIMHDTARVTRWVEAYARETKPELAAEVDRLEHAVAVARSVTASARHTLARSTEDYSRSVSGSLRACGNE